MRFVTKAVVLGALALAGCAGSQFEVPPPRPLVTREGARLTADHAKMQEVHTWVTRAVEVINEDPSFLLEEFSVPEPRYPWQTLELVEGDTVRIGYEATASDARTSYWVYAFLHLMKEMDRMDDWFPEAVELQGWELERFIAERTAESWILGRTTFDTQPYKPLDEIAFAHDAGYLEHLLLFTRQDEFPDELERLLDENPDARKQYQEWYGATFEGEAPGLDGG